MSITLPADVDKKLTSHAKLLGIKKKDYVITALKVAFARDNAAKKGKKDYEERADKRSNLTKTQLKNIDNAVHELKNKKITVKNRLKAESRLVNA